MLNDMLFVTYMKPLICNSIISKPPKCRAEYSKIVYSKPIVYSRKDKWIYQCANVLSAISKTTLHGKL